LTKIFFLIDLRGIADGSALRRNRPAKPSWQNAEWAFFVLSEMLRMLENRFVLRRPPTNHTRELHNKRNQNSKKRIQSELLQSVAAQTAQKDARCSESMSIDKI
jgi:hypothetical protein